MGEVINLNEWKAEKEKQEIEELHSEIQKLKAELAEMVKDMEDPAGCGYWPDVFIDNLPELNKIVTLLDGYSDFLGETYTWSDTDK